MSEDLDAGQGDAVRDRLRRYAELVRNSPHNLLSARGLAELEERHIPESLAFASTLPAGHRLLDVGSGGGLPGLVIAVARPDLEVHLLEATGKKAAFLSDAASALGLEVRIHHARAEALVRSELAEAFDLVTARAVAALDLLAPLVAPFLGSGGQFHAIKGERWREELEAAGPALARSGLTVLSTPDDTAREAGDPWVGPRVVVLVRT